MAVTQRSAQTTVGGAQRPGQARDVPQQYVVRERERVHVLCEHWLARHKADRLHVHQASACRRAVKREERQAYPGPRGDLPDRGLERLTLVESAIGQDDDELVQVLREGGRSA